MDAAEDRPDILGANLTAVGIVRLAAAAELDPDRAGPSDPRVIELVKSWMPDYHHGGTLSLLLPLSHLAASAAVQGKGGPDEAAAWLDRQSAALPSGGDVPEPVAIELARIAVEMQSDGADAATRRHCLDRYTECMYAWIRPEAAEKYAYVLILTAGRLTAELLCDAFRYDRRQVDRFLAGQTEDIMRTPAPSAPPPVPVDARDITSAGGAE
ncbi:hypothetical protein AN218_22290 [Streptomyces nanshensis]|uniref:Uncharacterized protein n=2 Tax=Streptomyces nanshensis TaxID=518642 RepID=A0A1E7KZ57_9ACTN|nr:hypothetical protein AN218_22290 [Streptomyces nanshensis]